MNEKELQAQTWAAYKNGQEIIDLSYNKEFNDLCRRHPYRESYKVPLNDLWNVLAKYGDPKDKDDDWWEGFIKAIDVPVNKCNGTDAYEYAKEYAVIVLNEVTRRYRA